MLHKILSVTRFSAFILVLSVLIISQTVFAGSFKLVKDINPGKSSSVIRDMNVGDQLFFWAETDSYPDKQLWTIDNAHGGTIQISYIDYDLYYHMAGVADMAVGTNCFFTLRRKSDWGYELWKGTSSGVEKLSDIPDYVHTAVTVSALGKYFFVPFTDPDYGRELWVSDGTTSGTRLVKDITAGPAGSRPYNLIEAGGELYFLVGYELWKSDGTSDNTRMVRNFDCDQCGTSSIQLMGVANDTLYIRLIINYGSHDLWRYETSSGQVSLVRSFTNLSTERYCYAGVGNTFYFINNTVEDPPEDRKYGLWKTDGTSAGTVLLKEWDGLWALSVPEQLTPADHFLYFVGGNNDNRELWVSNGTAGGTHQVKDISPTTSTKINYMISLGDTLFFIKDHYPSSGQLWMSDGTESGTVYTGFGTTFDSRPVTLNGQLFFYGGDENTDEYGGELYQYCPSSVHINKDGNCNGNTPCYETINDGYRASGAGTKIRVCTGYYLEDLIFNENKEIVFSGGWKTDYSDNSGGVSTIGGSLIVTGGTVIIEGMVINGGTTTLAKTKEQQFSCRLTESWSKMTSFQ